MKTSTAACSSSGAALAAADPAAAAAAAGEQDEEAEAAELEAVVAASQQALSQQGAGGDAQQSAQAAEPAAAAAAGAEGSAGEDKLFLYTFEQEVQYRRINSKQKKQQQDADGPDVAPKGSSSGPQQQRQCEQKGPEQGAQGAAGVLGAGSSSTPSAEQALQGISASPGEMLLLSADGLQVGFIVCNCCLHSSNGCMSSKQLQPHGRVLPSGKADCGNHLVHRKAAHK